MTTARRIRKPKVRLRDMSWRELLYLISTTFLYVVWNLIVVATFIILRPLIPTEWIAVCFALILVGSLFAVVYIFLEVIPNHIWRRKDDTKYKDATL